MTEQLNLFTGPECEAELRFVKLNKNAIMPTLDKDGDWILYAPEDILLPSDDGSWPLYTGLRILVDDKNVEVHIFNIENKYYYPRRLNHLTVRNGFNEDCHVAMYMNTRKHAPREEIVRCGWGLYEQDEIDRLPEYRTLKEKGVQLMDGTFEDYPVEVPINSVLVKRGTPIFVVQAYRKAKVTMIEEFSKDTTADIIEEDDN